MNTLFTASARTQLPNLQTNDPVRLIESAGK